MMLIKIKDRKLAIASWLRAVKKYQDKVSNLGKVDGGRYTYTIHLR